MKRTSFLLRFTGQDAAPARRALLGHLLFVPLFFIAVLVFTSCGISVAQAGEVDIVAFGGIYNALGANAEVRGSSPSRDAKNDSFKIGQIYGARFEWFSTGEFSSFFGVGIGVSYWERSFSVASGFRQTNVDSGTLLFNFSFLFRRPSGQFRPYVGTGLSVLVVDYNVTDTRNETAGRITQKSSLSDTDLGWHFLGGLKFFLPEDLLPESLPGRFFILGEYRYLLANLVTKGTTFNSLKDLVNGQFFIGGIGFQFRAPSL